MQGPFSVSEAPEISIFFNKKAMMTEFSAMQNDLSFIQNDIDLFLNASFVVSIQRSQLSA